MQNKLYNKFVKHGCVYQSAYNISENVTVSSLRPVSVDNSTPFHLHRTFGYAISVLRTLFTPLYLETHPISQLIVHLIREDFSVSIFLPYLVLYDYKCVLQMLKQTSILIGFSISNKLLHIFWHLFFSSVCWLEGYTTPTSWMRSKTSGKICVFS